MNTCTSHTFPVRCDGRSYALLSRDGGDGDGDGDARDNARVDDAD